MIMQDKRKQFHKIGRILLLLVCSMSIIACQKGKEDSKTEDTIKVKTEKAQKVEDKKIERESNVISVGEEVVTYQEVLTYMYMLKVDYEPRLGPTLWSFKVAEDKTFEELALEETVHMITEMKIIGRITKELGIALSTDERDEISIRANEYLLTVSEQDQQKYGVAIEMVEKIYAENELAKKMFDVSMNGVDTNITDDDAKQIAVQYIHVLTNGTDKNGNVIQMTEEQKAQARTKANDLHVQAGNAESFRSFAEVNTDVGTFEQTIGKSDITEEAFATAAFALKTEQISEVVETESGFYIIYCVNEFDEEATKKEKEEIILRKQTEIFEQQYKEWSAFYQVRISDLLWSQHYFG